MKGVKNMKTEQARDGGGWLAWTAQAAVKGTSLAAKHLSTRKPKQTKESPDWEVFRGSGFRDLNQHLLDPSCASKIETIFLSFKSDSFPQEFRNKEGQPDFNLDSCTNLTELDLADCPNLGVKEIAYIATRIFQKLKKPVSLSIAPSVNYGKLAKQLKGYPDLKNQIPFKQVRFADLDKKSVDTDSFPKVVPRGTPEQKDGIASQLSDLFSQGLEITSESLNRLFDDTNQGQVFGSEDGSRWSVNQEDGFNKLNHEIANGLPQNIENIQLSFSSGEVSKPNLEKCTEAKSLKIEGYIDSLREFGLEELRSLSTLDISSSLISMDSLEKTVSRMNLNQQLTIFLPRSLSELESQLQQLKTLEQNNSNIKFAYPAVFINKKVEVPEDTALETGNPLAESIFRPAPQNGFTDKSGELQIGASPSLLQKHKKMVKIGVALTVLGLLFVLHRKGKGSGQSRVDAATLPPPVKLKKGRRR